MDEPPVIEYPKWMVPHADHGDPECCGLILPKMNGGIAELRCNECGVVLRTIPAAEVDNAMLELSSGDICSATCPHCGMPNIFPGFSSMLAYRCRHCGEGVEVETRVQ